jgi:uncharacterized membrane protein
VLYLILKTIHILSVIIALGANLTYGFLLSRAEKEPIHFLFMLKTIRWIDKYIANRCYILALLTGVSLVWIANYSFSSLWIWLSLSLFALVAILGITLYAPIIRAQQALIEQNQMTSHEYQKVRSKSQILGIAVTLLVISILVLMVAKPV